MRTLMRILSDRPQKAGKLLRRVTRLIRSSQSAKIAMSTSTTGTQQETKKLTITLTDRPPVKIVEADWPIIAESSWGDHDGQVECQANRKWSAWLKARQHDDGRTIVYGHYCYTTNWQNEASASYRDGQMITPSAEDYPEAARKDHWTGARIVSAIHEVGGRLAERSKHECWTDLMAEIIADLPADELS